MAETRLKVTYSVTSTTNSTQLFKTSYFSKAELADGTELPSNIFDVGNHAYVFSATGNNDVFYTMTGNTIGDEAFEGMTRIVAVDIPSTVTTLGERCFRNCTNLSSVTLADTVSSFGEGAFDADVALESIVIPSTAVTMSDKVFRGCTGLTSITMSDTTAPAVSADTFYQVQTGGTLYYPTGSTYSNWLSNNQYYLGYYNWNGVETGGTPSGSSVQYMRSQSLGLVSYSMISGASVSDTMPPTEVAGVLHVKAVPYGSNPNIEWTIGHNDLDMSLCGNTVYGSNTDQANNVVTCRHLVTFDSTIEGYTDIAIRETTSNYNVSLRVINRLPGSTATPGVLASPSAVTFSSSGYDGEYYKIADVVCNGFTPDTNSAHSDVFLTTSSPYVPWYGRPFTDFVWRDNHYVIRLSRVYENSGSSRQSKLLKAFTPNTNVQIISDSATTYLFVFGMDQEGSGSTPTPSDRWMVLSEEEAKIPETESRYNFYVEASGCSIDSSHTPTISFKSADNQSTITWLNQGRATFDANNSRWEIEYHADENTGVERYANIVIDGVYDMDGNVYNSNPQAGDASSLIYYVTQYEGTPTPSDAYIRFVDTAITLTGSYVSAALEVSGCTSISDYCTYTGTGAIDFTTIYQFYDSCTINANPNTGSTQLESDLRVAFQDTDGNVYYDTIHVIQPVQVNAYFDPASISVAPGAGTASTTAVGLNCTVASVAFDRIYWSGGTWAVDPTFTINGDVVTFQVPENTTNNFRYVMYYFTITDTDGNTYTAQFYLGQYNMRVYLDPYEIQFGASVNVKGNNLRVLPSGTTIDSSYTPTYVSSADWLHVDRHMWSELESGWTIFYGPDRNTTNQTREGYITVNGVHDTYGVVYDGLVCHVTQYSGSYVFANYVSSVSSAETDTTVEIVGVNTNICSVTVSGFTGHPADRWEGFEQPSYTQLGNYITVHIPENDVTGRSRTVQFSAVTIYGESCENTEVLRVTINQAKSGATPTPVQKDIKAADTSYSVGSGSGNASTTVQTTGCTYDHFTYITGGSFSVTATSGPNNTIVFTYPENPTTSPRTGYVYITFYDSDGNAYGPQTITLTQQAGSSPGPGPGPDPETGYVLTTLTISDQEQHRYFVEARPGVVYSAAGQYYKTIPACEARYSLYYVNSYGGVDVLPFKGGGQKKTDNITRFNYSRSFRNNTPEFENVNYMNEIKAVWELQTGWIGDDGSSRMHELVESTIVYLYDAEEKTYTPVVMTDKKLEYKTYRNQGRKFYNYTINVEESQSRERR